jgi:putative inorganic carbon (HCO3(-)) transporter
LDILLSNDTLGSLNGRMEVWSRAIYMIQDFPFTGIGMGTFTPVADALYPFFLAEPGSISHAHNLFLQVGVDLGIPGLLAWLAIWMLVLVTAWQVYQHGRAIHDGWVMGLGAALCCSQLALVTHGLLDAVTWGMVKPAPIVWALWGLTMASGRVCISRVIKTRSSFDGKAFDLN